MGTKNMKMDGVDVHEIDATHCVVRVSWNSTYQKPGSAETDIPFDVSYLLEQRDGKLRVFGWIAGDEEALLKANGVL
jgi:hypothetical protein